MTSKSMRRGALALATAFAVTGAFAAGPRKSIGKLEGTSTSSPGRATSNAARPTKRTIG